MSTITDSEVENDPIAKFLVKIHEIQHKKKQDYASSEDRYDNFKRAGYVIGWFKHDMDKTFVNHIATKLARLATLLNHESHTGPQNEPIEDSFLDLATYCVLWATYREGKR